MRNFKLFVVLASVALLPYATPAQASLSSAARTTGLSAPLPLDAVAAPQWIALARAIVGQLLDAGAAMTPASAAPATVTVELLDSASEETQVFELPLDGQFSPELRRSLSTFFHCPARGRRQMDVGVLTMLAELAHEYPGHVIEITSAYRGGAEERSTSPHLAGRALDLRVHGVRTTTVRDWLWRTHTHVGVGWYPHSDFVHMDTRPDLHDTSWTQREMNDHYQYNPWWAEKARMTASAK